MNAYASMGKEVFTLRDVSRMQGGDGYTAGALLALLERQRNAQSMVEIAGLLEQNGVTPRSRSARITTLRRAAGEALVRAGLRLAGGVYFDTLSTMPPAAGAGRRD